MPPKPYEILPSVTTPEPSAGDMGNIKGKALCGPDVMCGVPDARLGLDPYQFRRAYIRPRRSAGNRPGS